MAPADKKKNPPPPPHPALAGSCHRPPRSSDSSDFPCMPARTTSSHFHLMFPSVRPIAGMTAKPSRARPVPLTIPPPANDWTAMAPDSQSAPKPVKFLLSFPGVANPPAHFQMFRWPAFCSNVPAIAQSALSVPTSHWHTAPAFFRSGCLAWHPPPPPAPQTTLPAAAPPAPPYLARDTGRPPSGVHCHFADRLPGFAGIPPARRPSSPSAKASPPFLHGGLHQHDCGFPASAVLRQ